MENIKKEYYFGLKWYGKGSQNLLIPKLVKPLRLIKCVVNYRHLWTIMKEDNILNFVKNNNSFICEILCDYPCRVFFDIDCTEVDKLNLEQVKEIINKYFENPRMAISGSETSIKKSYHITLPDIIIQNSDDLLKLKQKVGSIKKYICEYFDDSVYNKNKAFKCIYQSKESTLPQQMIIENNNEKEHFINSYLTGQESRIKFIEYEDLPTEYVDTKKIPRKKLKLPENFKPCDLDNNHELLKLLPNGPEYNHGYTWKVAIFCNTYKISFDEFWNWAKQKDDSVERYNKWKNIHWKTIEEHKLKTDNDSILKLLGFSYNELANVLCSNDLITRKFLNTLNLNREKSIQQTIDNLGVNNVNKKYNIIESINQSHFNVSDKALIFNIGMGGGKTTQCVEYLKNNKHMSFIWITPRITLVKNTNNRFKENGLDVLNYGELGTDKEKKKDKIDETMNLIIEAESLNLIRDTYKFDIIVIDEIETVLKGWDSETHKKNIKDNFNNFKQLLKNSKKVILLDAFTTTTTLDLLEDLKIKDYKIYASAYKPPAKICIENKDYQETIKKVARELDEGKKLYIFYAYKRGTKIRYSIDELKSTLLEECQTKPKILVYHGESDDVKKNKLANATKEWDKYDCILTTSAITVGVNYEGNRYDKIYLFIAGSVNNIRDVIQSSMRIRKTNENILELYFFEKTKDSTYEIPDYYKETEDMIYKKIVDSIMVEKQANFMGSFYKFCELTNYDCSGVSVFKNFTIKNKSEEFVNKLFESKMLMPYNSIESLTPLEANEIEKEKVWTTNATQLDKIRLNKYYFDIKYILIPEDDRALIWDNNGMKFMDNINTELINRIIKDNGKDSLLEINLEKIKVSKETMDYMDSIYNSTLKIERQKIIKTINKHLGLNVIESIKDKSNNCKLKFNNLAEDLYDININWIKEKSRFEKLEIVDE